MAPNYNTATPAEIIAWSAGMHPSTLRDALMAMSDTHKQAASSTLNADAARIATALAYACRKAAYYVDDYEPKDAAANIMAEGMDCWTSALIAACRLLCIPPALRQDIAARHNG